MGPGDTSDVETVRNSVRLDPYFSLYPPGRMKPSHFFCEVNFASFMSSKGK